MAKHRSFFMARVTYLPSRGAHPSKYKTISLASALLSGRWKKQVLDLREERDPERQAIMKQALPGFTPSGTFTRRNAAGLVEHSGFIGLDIDLKDNAHIKNFSSLKKMIHALPWVAYCGLSCRGQGFFALVPIADPAKHREYFRALQADLARAGLTVDKNCKDVCRFRFVSYDPDPYINTAARLYDYTLPPKEYVQREVEDVDQTKAAKQMETILQRVDEMRLDVQEHDDRLGVFHALKNVFDEDAARAYAHRFFAYHYDPDEIDEKFDEALRYTYPYSFDFIERVCRKYGIPCCFDFDDLDDYADDVEPLDLDDADREEI